MKRISRVFFGAVTICAFMALLSPEISAQTDPPEDPEVPEVVSRDENVEKPPTVTPKKSRTDVRENQTPTEDTIILPPNADNSGVRTAGSPLYKIDLTESQQKLILYLDILTKTEARAEGLRTKFFELVEKENELKSEISQIEYGLRPEQIQNAAALSGSLRPEEVRGDRQKILQNELSNKEALLRGVERSRRTLEAALVSADRLVERVRAKFEDFVDKALTDETEN